MLSFNPRSRVGSDFSDYQPDQRFFCFNPRSRVGSDVKNSQKDPISDSFNPRSRVGSDQKALIARSVRTCFNPRSRVGSDIFFASFLFPIPMFQSTLPRRERPKQSESTMHTLMFQSTLPRRERPPGQQIATGDTLVSIHAPA